MKKYFAVIFILCLSILTFGQNTHKFTWSKKSIYETTEINSGDSDCFYKEVYSNEERRNLFPFKSAAKVLIIFYLKGIDKSGEEEKVWHPLPIVNDSIQYDLIEEFRDLTNEQIDQLSDILFNVGFQETKALKDSRGCYNPRNGIIFLDNEGKPFAYIELCFECLGKKISPEEMNIGPFCIDKYFILKKYFTALGIKTESK